MSEIRVLIYRLGMYNLQTKTVSFPNQQKLLEFSLTVSMNVNTKNSQIKHCPCPKYFAIKGPTCKIYKPEKTSEK